MAESILVLLITLMSFVVAICATVLPIALVIGIIVWRIKSGRGVVIQTNIPGVAEAIAGAVQPAQQKGGAMQMKKVNCRSCGAAKLTPPKTAYLYCDYCGALTDWDFKIACQSTAKPGPEYERLQAQEGPAQARAKAERNEDAYRESLTRVFDGHMTHCPASYSPRLGDPDYRAALLDFTVNTYLAAAFDPDAQEAEAAMARAVQQLQWIPGFGTTRAESKSFHHLVETFKAHNQRFIELCRPFAARHPDQPSEEMMLSISSSAFVQGWMPYLDQAEQQWVIAELGLAGEYIPLQPVETVQRHCGGCGSELAVVQGAKRVVCESCGRMNDMQRPELQCTGCGGALSLPHGKDRFSCPSCGSELRIDGIAP